MLVCCAFAAAAPPVASAAPAPLLVSRQDPSAGGAPSDGDATDVALSADGRLVVFASSAKNLGSPRDDSPATHLFLHDRVTGSTTLVSPPGLLAYAPALSADGNTLAFLGARGYHVEGDVYVRDLRTGSLEVVAHHAPPDGTGMPLPGPHLSADGRTVAYGAQAGGGSIVRVLDRRSGRTRTLAPPDGGEATGLSVAAGGGVVAWSNERNGQSAAEVSVFRYDLRRHRRRRVARYVAPGSLIDFGAYGTSLSRDGRVLAFVRWHGFPSPDHARPQVVVQATRSGRTKVIDRLTGMDPSLSADGRRMVLPSRRGSVLRNVRRQRSKRLTAAWAAAFAADGHWLAYIDPAFPRQAYEIAVP